MSLSNEGELCIQLPGEMLVFDDQDKPIFHNTNGESVTEYSGLASDGNEMRSWAKAIFQTNGFSELHYHHEHTENYYIIEGQAQVTLDDVVYTLSVGDSITIPPGVHHQVSNISAENESLVLIVKCEPAWTVNDFHLVDAPSISKRF